MRRKILSIVALALIPVPLVYSQSQSEASKSRTFDPRDVFVIWSPPSRQLSRQAGSSNQKVSNAPEPPLTAWAKEHLVFKNGITHGTNINPAGEYPGQNCDPIGVPAQYAYNFLYPMELVQAQGRIYQFFEYHREWRVIWMDGRSHPKDPDPSYMGDSIGKWEGDTLVVDTVGFNGKEFLDQNVDHRMSDAFHLVERFRRISYDVLQIDMTLYDPKAWGDVPWTGWVRNYQFKPSEQLQEFICTTEENSRFDQNVLHPITSPNK